MESKQSLTLQKKSRIVLIIKIKNVIRSKTGVDDTQWLQGKNVVETSRNSQKQIYK